MPVVTIRIENDLPSPTNVEDVVVEFYSTAGVFQTSGTTDSAGEVQVTLPEDEYDLFFYKVGVSILPKQPQRIDVLPDPDPNIFLVTCHEREMPESVDPLRCTVSGRILGVDGKQSVHRLIFSPVKNLLSLDGNVIALHHRVEVKSDADGYFEFELLRNQEYNAYFVFPEDLFGQQPGKLDIVTPDQPSAALDKLLFPLPVDLEFSAATISLSAGAVQDETITTTITFSDGSVRTTLSSPWAYIKVENTDNTIVEAFISGSKLCLRPLTAGTATITTTRVMSTHSVIDPLPAYASESVEVTVT